MNSQGSHITHCLLLCLSGSCDGQEDFWHLRSPRGRSYDPLPQHGDPGSSANLHHKGWSVLLTVRSVITGVIWRLYSRETVSSPHHRTRAHSTWKTQQRTCWRAWAARCPSTSAGGTLGHWWWRKEVETHTFKLCCHKYQYSIVINSNIEYFTCWYLHCVFFFFFLVFLHALCIAKWH